MTPQYLLMTPLWDSFFQSPANQQPIRYRFTAVTGYSGPAFDPYLPWLGPVQPSAYIDLQAIYASPTGEPFNINNSAGEVLLDANGKPLFLNYGCAGGTCPQYLADMTNPTFRANFIAALKANLSKGYKQIFLDDVNLDLKSTDGTGNFVPPAGVNTQNWPRAVVEFLEQIRAAFPGVTIIQNSVWFSAAPQEFIDRQIKSTDYIMNQRGVGDPNLNPSTTLQEMMYIDHVHSMGRKIIQEEEQPVTPAGLAYWLNFFRVMYQPGDLFAIEEQTAQDPSLDVDIGTPYARAQIGPFQYTRQFSNGWATVDINAKTGEWTPNA